MTPRVESVLALDLGTVTGASIDISSLGIVGVDLVVWVFYHGVAAIDIDFPDDHHPLVSVQTDGPQTHSMFWHRASGAESGTVSFAWGVSSSARVIVLRISGAARSGNPFEFIDPAVDNGDVTASPAVALPGHTADSLLLWSATSKSGVAWTVPTGFTDHGQVTQLVVASKSSDGTSTGSLAATSTVANETTALLVSVLPTTVLTIYTGDVADGRTVRITGLPDFNAGDASFRITNWEGIFATPVPDAQYSATGGAGAVASGAWLPRERPMVLQGFINADLSQLPGYARALAASLPATDTATIQILANGRDDLDLQVFVRRYDRADFPISSRLDFTIPLLALDPYLYGLDPLTGGIGVFAGTYWFGSYSKPSSTWVKTYVKNGSNWFATYSNTQPPGPYPDTLALTPPLGATSSRRLTFQVVGPLAAGNWQLSQVGTGREMWVQASIPAGQSLTIDCYEETVNFNGEDYTSLLYGDMLTLEPGGSTFQLTSSAPNAAAYALVSALPAYEI